MRSQIEFNEVIGLEIKSSVIDCSKLTARLYFEENSLQITGIEFQNCVVFIDATGSHKKIERIVPAARLSHGLSLMIKGTTPGWENYNEVSVITGVEDEEKQRLYIIRVVCKEHVILR